HDVRYRSSAWGGGRYHGSPRTAAGWEAAAPAHGYLAWRPSGYQSGAGRSRRGGLGERRQRQSRLHRGGSRLVALVVGPGLGSFHRVGHLVYRQHAVRHGYSLVAAHQREPAGGLGGDDRVVVGVPFDDHPQRQDRKST